MGRPMTFRGRKPTSSSSSSSTGELRNLLYVLYEAGFCFIFKRKLRVKGQLSAVVDRMIWPFWISPWQVTRGSKLEGKARWPSTHAPEELNSFELGPIQ